MVRVRPWQLGLCVGALLFGCSADSSSESGAGSGGSSRGDTANPFGNAGGTGSGSGGGGKLTGINGGGTGGDQMFTSKPGSGDDQGTDTITSTFIWIANSAEGTVSKLDTRTMTELGRYRTSPSGTGLPSRTSVAADGSVAVANRGGATAQMAGDGGGVMRIMSDPEKCQDKNGNGTIDTSSGPSDVKGFMEDECVVWFTAISHFSNRPVAWAPPAGPDLPADLWTAGATTCSAQSCTIDVFRLDGETGAIKDTVNISGLSGVDMITAGGGAAVVQQLNPLAGLLFPDPGGLILNYGPYGGASDSGGNFWVFVANTTQLIRVDALDLTYRTWPTPMGNGYGMAIDDKGRVWVCGALGVSRFDPSTETWTDNFTDVDTGFNGCMGDGAGKMWVGGGSDLGTTGLFGFDTETMMLADQVNADTDGVPMNVKGVSVDVDGKIWGVSSVGAAMTGAGNIAWRFDPASREVAKYEGLSGAYSYSDMTGFGLTHAGILIPPIL